MVSILIKKMTYFSNTCHNISRSHFWWWWWWCSRLAFLS